MAATRTFSSEATTQKNTHTHTRLRLLLSNWITNPRLQLLYSSCCGHCLCSGCVHTLFSAHSADYSSTATTACPACSTPLTPRDFDPAPLSTQRYTKEVRFSGRLNWLTSMLRRVDFSNEWEWEQWKEWKEDVVWLVVEGGRQDERR